MSMMNMSIIYSWKENLQEDEDGMGDGVNVFIYKKPDTFQKARQFPLRFYIQKAIHFTFRDFSSNFQRWNLYTKIMTLCVT